MSWNATICNESMNQLQRTTVAQKNQLQRTTLAQKNQLQRTTVAQLELLSIAREKRWKNNWSEFYKSTPLQCPCKWWSVGVQGVHVTRKSNIHHVRQRHQKKLIQMCANNVKKPSNLEMKKTGLAVTIVPGGGTFSVFQLKMYKTSGDAQCIKLLHTLTFNWFKTLHSLDLHYQLILSLDLYYNLIH